MKQLATTNSTGGKIWLYVMILSMLFVQSLQLHVHTYTHKAEVLGHVHYESAHSVFDISQAAHADEVAQHDMNHSGLLSKLSFMSVLAIVLFSLLLIQSAQTCIRLAKYNFKPALSKSYHCHFRPPLRAPPQS